MMFHFSMFNVVTNCFLILCVNIAILFLLSYPFPAINRLAEWHEARVNRAANMKDDEDYQSSNYRNA